ncbi:MAG: acetylglutamate kinase [Bacteroidota bacterium]|nr:acetylglutamate kinase [Bacteroidota bacterium]
MKTNMYYGASNLIFQRAEELRNRMTPAEEILWQHIHINHWKRKFRRQHPIWNYVVDFYCHALKLVIELDGEIHEVDEVKKNDEIREVYLKDLGLTVLRFKNHELYNNLNTVLEKISETIGILQSTPLGDGGKSTLFIIKIGGNIIDDEKKLSSFLKQFAAIEEHKILIHGGGKLATRMAEELHIPQQVVEGRRITDAETLKIVTMVYAGYINKNIVAKLQANNCNAMGLCGADGDTILAHKRQHPVMDYGFVGDVDAINAGLISSLLEKNITPVFAPITHDQQGQLLNTNADTIAQELAKGLSNLFEVTLIYCFEKNGVLLDTEDDSTVIPFLNPASYKKLKEAEKIFAGMIPKIDNAFAALNSGVNKIIIGKAENLGELVQGNSGTAITNEQ